MNKIENNVAPFPVAQVPPKFTKQIGKTTYEVTVHFSQTSTETLTDKIKRLIQNEISSC